MAYDAESQQQGHGRNKIGFGADLQFNAVEKEQVVRQ
jgi:hypothetical protein